MDAFEDFIGEYVECDSSEIEEAANYLNLWKKFFLRKHQDLKVFDTVTIYQPPFVNGELGRIGIKLKLKEYNNA